MYLDLFKLSQVAVLLLSAIVLKEYWGNIRLTEKALAKVCTIVGVVLFFVHLPISIIELSAKKWSMRHVVGIFLPLFQYIGFITLGFFLQKKLNWNCSMFFKFASDKQTKDRIKGFIHPYAKQGALYAIVFALVSVIWTYAIYHFIPYELLKEQITLALSLPAILIWGLFILGQAPFALGEEIIYRLGIQSYLRSRFNFKYGSWLAILISSLLWTLGHYGRVDPSWLVYLQLFPIGIGLGVLQHKYGIESNFIAHTLFNATVGTLLFYKIF